MADGSMRVKTGFDNSGAKKDAKEFERIVDNAAEKAEKAGGKTSFNVDVSQAEKEIKRLEKEIEKYESKISQLEVGKLGEYNRERESLNENTKADLAKATSPKQKANVLEMHNARLAQIESNYATVLEQANQYGHIIAQNDAKIEKLKNTIEQIKNAQSQTNSEQTQASSSTEQTATHASRLKQMIKSAKSAAGEFARYIGVTAYKGISKVGGVVKNIVAAGLKKAVTSLKNVGKSADNLRKKFLRIGLALVGIRTLMSGLRQIVSSALSDNETLQNQLTAIKGILGQALTPAINAMITALTKVVSLVDQVYQAFTGTSLIAAYNAQQASKLADSTSDAADAAEEYQNQLAGFDVANKLTDNTSLSSASSGSSDTSTTFEPSYSESVSKFAQMIKEAWEQADFTDVGNTISAKLVSMLQGISWENIKSKAFGAGKSFATLLNGLFSYSDEDGNTLATSIAEFLAEAFNTLVMLALGFVKNLDWKNIGTELAKGLLKALSKIDWGKLGELIHDFLIGLCDAIAAFFDKLSEGDEGYETIKKAVTDFFNGLKIGEIIISVLKCVVSIAKFAFNFLGNLEADLWDAFWNWVCDKFGWELEGYQTVNLAGGAMGGLTITLPKIKFKFGSSNDEEDDGSSFWDKIVGFFGKSSPIVAALGTGTGTSTITATINGSVSDSFTKLKEKWDSISEKGKSALTTIKGSVNSTFSTLKTKWDSIKNKTNTSSIKGSIQNTFNTLKSKWDGIKSKTTTITATVKDKATSIFKNIANSLISFINQAISKINSKLKISIGSSLSKVLKAVGINVSSGSYQLFTIPSIPKLARGGIVNNPGRGVTVTAGEAGPEAILPLNDSALSKLAAMISEHQQSAAGQIIVPIYFDSKKIVTYMIDAQNKQAFALNKGGAY